MQIENFKYLRFSSLTKASSLEVSESIPSNKYLHGLVFKTNVCNIKNDLKNWFREEK